MTPLLSAAAARADIPVLSILGTGLTAAAAVVTIAFLRREAPSEWKTWLLVAWAIWLGRYFAALAGFGLWPFAGVVPFVLPLLRETAIVLALRALGERRLTGPWLCALGVLGATTAAWLAGRVGLPVLSQVYFATAALPWVAGAVVIPRAPSLQAPERWLLATGFALQGLSTLLAHWYGVDDRLLAFSVGFNAFIHVSVTLGLAGCVRRRMLAHLEAVEQRRSRALEFVARGLVPMCAHCRSIRNRSGDWKTVAQFVAEDTALPVQDALCPECAAGWRAAAGGSGG